MTNVAHPGNKISTHDLILTNGANVVSLLLCDAEGKRDPTAFRPMPLPGSAFKFASGVQKYEDLEGPWDPRVQNDWSGGKGSKDFDKDQTKYFDGYQVNTVRPGEIILAGKPTEVLVQAGIAVAGNTSAGSDTLVVTDGPTTVWDAFQFTAPATITPTYIVLTVWISAGTIWAGLGDITAGLPATITLSTNSHAASEFTPGVLQAMPFIVSKALTSGTAYCLVLKWVS